MRSSNPSPGRPACEESSRVDLVGGAWIARSELRFAFSRSSGPGGQAVNKLSTRAELRVRISAVGGLDHAALDRLRKLAGRRLTREDEIVLHAQTSRSQLDNKNECLRRLEILVEKAAHEPVPRKRKKVSKSMIRKRLEAKRSQSKRKSARRWKPEAD